ALLRQCLIVFTAMLQNQPCHFRRHPAFLRLHIPLHEPFQTLDMRLVVVTWLHRRREPEKHDRNLLCLHLHLFFQFLPRIGERPLNHPRVCQCHNVFFHFILPPVGASTEHLESRNGFLELLRFIPAFRAPVGHDLVIALQCVRWKLPDGVVENVSKTLTVILLVKRPTHPKEVAQVQPHHPAAHIVGQLALPHNRVDLCRCYVPFCPRSPRHVL